MFRTVTKSLTLALAAALVSTATPALAQFQPRDATTNPSLLLKAATMPEYAAVVDKVVEKRGTRLTAQAYLDYLYSEEGQQIAARHYYRPTHPTVAGQYARQFPKLKLVTIDDTFGGWQKAQKTHFADGGTFDQIYLKK